MGDELRAAERLGGNWYDTYGCTEEGLSRSLLVDIEIVRQAVLANHPADDGEPVGPRERALAAKLREYACHPHEDSWHGELMVCDLCGATWNNGEKRNESPTPEVHKPGCLLAEPSDR